MPDETDEFPESLTPWILQQDYDPEGQSQALEDVGSPSRVGEAHSIATSSEVGEPSEQSSTQAASSSVQDQDESEARVRRRIQNRVAQRAFRDRKQSYAKDLETRVNSAEERVQRLTAEKNALEHVLQQAKTENEKLQQEAAQHPEHPIASVLLESQSKRHKDDTYPESGTQNR